MNCKVHEILGQHFSWYKLGWFHCLPYSSTTDVHWAPSQGYVLLQSTRVFCLFFFFFPNPNELYT